MIPFALLFIVLAASLTASISGSFTRHRLHSAAKRRAKRAIAAMEPLTPVAEYIGEDIPFLDVPDEMLRPIGKP